MRVRQNLQLLDYCTLDEHIVPHVFVLLVTWMTLNNNDKRVYSNILFYVAGCNSSTRCHILFRSVPALVLARARTNDVWILLFWVHPT